MPEANDKTTAGEDKASAIGASAEKQSQAPPAPTPKQQVPSLGRIVIVREEGKNDAPGIVAEVFEDTITCNVFRGDHFPHVAAHLTQIDPESSGTGWFWPPRV